MENKKNYKGYNAMEHDSQSHTTRDYSHGSAHKNKFTSKSSSFINKNLEKYGERVPTFFHWVSPDYQKERAEKLENLDNQNSPT